MAKKRLWNDGWSFTELPVEDASYEFPVNATWQYVDIPHDWMIYKTHELYRDSIGWYKKEFCMEELSGQTLLRFDGIYMDTTVYINGTPVKEWKYGYSMFEADISDYITEGKNLVAVRVVYRYLNTRWYSGAGIFRNVWFKEREKCHIVSDGIYVTPVKEDDQKWIVEVDTELELSGAPEEGATYKLCQRLLDEDGAWVEETTATVRFCGTEKMTCSQILFMEEPKVNAQEQFFEEAYLNK